MHLNRIFTPSQQLTTLGNIVLRKYKDCFQINVTLPNAMLHNRVVSKLKAYAFLVSAAQEFS